MNQGVTYNEKGKYWEENEPQIQGAVDAAKNVDVIVACIGENSYTETPGNLTDLWLSENQRNLVKELAKTGKPVVLILNEGRPRLIADIEPLAQGIIDILIPGNMGGDALVNLVSGKSNFSGKICTADLSREIDAHHTQLAHLFDCVTAKVCREIPFDKLCHLGGFQSSPTVVQHAVAVFQVFIVHLFLNIRTVSANLTRYTDCDFVLFQKFGDFGYQ